MMDWITNKPNARFWVLKLIKDSFGPGDKLVDTNLSGSASADVEAQAFLTPSGHKLLLVNKRNHSVEIKLPDAQNASALAVDKSTGEGPAHFLKPIGGEITMEPFAVSVVRW
jgi:hypothetical protein